jgi:hypothetical protein
LNRASGIAPGDHAIIGPARFGHQHISVARGLRLDDVARRRRADFLVRGEQHRDWQRRRERRAGELPDRLQREVVAALHVEDAGAETFVALAPPLQFFQRADGMDGIEMPGDQDSGLALFRMWKTRAYASAKALAAGDALDRRSHDRHVARGDVEHAVHGAGIPGRAFAFHPAAQPLQHGLGIERKVGGIHLDFFRTEWWWRVLAVGMIGEASAKCNLPAGLHCCRTIAQNKIDARRA